MNEWKRTQIEHFDELSSRYDSIKKEFYLNDATRNIKELVKGKSVLYVGCGTGIMLSKLEPKDVHGIDISSGMIKEARKKYPQYRFDVADAENYTPVKRYDVALLLDCIDHMQNWKRVIENVEPYADELIVTTTPKRWHPILRAMELLNMKMDEGTNRWVSSSELKEYLGDCETIMSRYGLSVVFRRCRHE